MNSMTVTFDEWPLWVFHENVNGMIAASKLKELRENAKIRYKTIEGKLAYPLVDLLKHAGITKFLMHAEAIPVVSNGMVEDQPKEIATSIAKEIKEEVKEEKEDEADFTSGSTKEKVFLYSDLFTYSSPSLPSGTPIPVFKVRQSQGTGYVQTIEGKIVDIQWYKARQGQEEFPKVRFILHSTKHPTHYLVLQTRCDKFHSGHFINVLAECIAVSNNLDKTISIKLEADENGKPKFTVSLDNQDWTYTNPETYQEALSLSVIKNKLIAALNNVKHHEVHKVVITENSDNSKIDTSKAATTNQTQHVEF